MTMCKRLRLTVLSSNFTAIRLYEKSGFRFTGNDRILKDDLLEREMVYISEHLYFTDLVGGVMTPPYRGGLEILYG